MTSGVYTRAPVTRDAVACGNRGEIGNRFLVEIVVADSAGRQTPATDNCEIRYLTLRFAADSLPRLFSISYSTVCPSLSVRNPARSTAEMWTNTSLPPPPEG